MEMRFGRESDQGWDDLFIVVEGGIGLSEEGIRRWCCRFNILVSARERRRCDKALMEDEVEAVTSSWLHGKEAWHGAAAWWCRPEERWHRGGEREEIIPVGLMQIFLGQKMKKIDMVNSIAPIEWWRFKAMMSYFFLNIYKWDLVSFISSRRTQWWKRIFKWMSYDWDKSF
jgi:hypothetical protein